jgi:hypothetical protein
MPDTKQSDLDEFEQGLNRSKKAMKRLSRRIEGTIGRSTFAGLKAERREAMIASGAEIERLTALLRKDVKAALNLDDRKDKA